MVEPVTMVPDPPLSPIGPGSGDLIAPPQSLEQRVQRLEDAVAALQETQLVEERVVERVQARLQGRPEPQPPLAARPAAAEQMYDAARYTVPPPSPAAPAEAAFAKPPATGTVRLLPHAWLLFDLFAEARAMVRMFFDIHYHVAWTTRLVVLVLVPLILLSHWWFPFAWVPLVGPLGDKLVDLLLAFFVYKALSREAHRYLETRSGGRGW
jgi:hypothetical protein